MRFHTKVAGDMATIKAGIRTGVEITAAIGIAMACRTTGIGARGIRTAIEQDECDNLCKPDESLRPKAARYAILRQ